MVLNLLPIPLSSFFLIHAFRALHESLHVRSASDSPDGNSTPSSPSIDPDLAMALRLSQEEQDERQQELLREQEMLEKAIRLSMEEK